MPGHPWPEPRELGTAVRLARGGDQDAFRLLYTDVQPRLLRYLRALVGGDAEDVASETWLQVVRDLGAFHGDLDGFRGWVATIGRHRASDHLRSLRRRPQAAEVRAGELESWAASDSTEDQVLAAAATDAAIALIARLPQDQAEAVLLRVVMGLDASQAGQVLGKRAGAVRTASHRGLRTLAGWLAAPGPRPEASPGAAGRGRAGKPATAAVTFARASALKDMR